MHLERDSEEPHALDGYQVTPLVRSLVGRLGQSLSKGSGTRAWSVTGPYGTGKSAFALFLASLLAPETVSQGRARALLRSADAELGQLLLGKGGPLASKRGLLPVLVTGERRTLEELFLGALSNALAKYWGGRGATPAIVGEVARAAKRAAAGRKITARDVVELTERAAAKVKESAQPGDGLLLILDEAGKPLEFAAHQPDGADVQLLQELAEAANRSADTPLVLVVMLHQAFEQYAGRLSSAQRQEWAKVQGRFEDLAFLEPPEQLLRLIGAAFDHHPLPQKQLADVQGLAVNIAEIANPIDFPDKSRLRALLQEAAPLHPVTALCVGPLFRSRLAQNERSLFAFLGANEPHGLQEHLRGGTAQLYPLDRLYDYVASAFAGRMYGRNSQHWARVEEALRRLPTDAGSEDARVVKALGVLTSLADSGSLPASEDVLAIALSTGPSVARTELQACLKRLQQASIIVYRRYKNAYQLWEGSDLDVDALVSGAVAKLDPRASLVERLTRFAPPRPIVAKRHLFTTGSLRYFDLRFADEALLSSDLSQSKHAADGVIWIAIPSSASEAASLTRQLSSGAPLLASSTSERPFVVAVPKNVERLREVAMDLAALEWVQNHTPELQSDAVARREVAARLADAERVLRAELGSLAEGDGCVWWYRGEFCSLGTARRLSGFLSDICDDVYRHCPVIKNELLNRRHLSSAAAAARRTLIQAMVLRGSDAQLGIEGSPPELSMYRSVFEQHQLHQKRDGAWVFAAPVKKSSLRPAWDRLVRELAEAQGRRIRIAELYDLLRRPPFGIHDGVLPVLLTAIVLQSDAEVAVYEDGAFVPKLTPPVVERFLRSPDKFELQHFQVAGSGIALFERLFQMLSGGKQATPTKLGLVPVVRELVRLVQSLPDYSRNTQSVSDLARAVREALLRAREPGTLLFKQLPEACGLSAFAPHRAAPGPDVEVFVNSLRDSLRELQGAFPGLMREIREGIADAFGLSRSPDGMRRELAARSAQLLPVAVDSRLKGFLIRVLDESLESDEWLNSLATLLGGKPPAAWRDIDLDEMRLNLGIVHQRFSSLESLMLERAERDNPDGTRLIRIAVAQPGALESERVVSVRDEDQELVEKLCSRLRETLSAARAELPQDAVLASLAFVAAEGMKQLSGEDTTAQAEKMRS
ncbi:MAG: hypothetical protein HS104_26995 [Polyangiaceae bacterium]|nr:hypothetical protein [Polyangiaceae bacterium]